MIGYIQSLYLKVCSKRFQTKRQFCFDDIKNWVEKNTVGTQCFEKKVLKTFLHNYHILTNYDDPKICILLTLFKSASSAFFWGEKARSDKG